MKTTVYFDLETGGVLPEHPNTQLAAVAVDDYNGTELEAFEAKIQFDPAVCAADALAINHYTPDAWQDAESEGDVCHRFRQFLARHACIEKISAEKKKAYSVCKLYGYNAATFDGPRLVSMFKRNGVFLPAEMRIRCVLQTAMQWFDQHAGPQPERLKLVNVCEFLDIPTVGAHDALADVRMTVRLNHYLRDNAPGKL